MSKIKVDQIESSDTNVKLAAKGTNAVQIKGAGSDDAALQLSSGSGSHGVKIKSPNHSAGQSHTLILPDNNIEADKFLKVKSITGSGNNAVGQLEYASISSPDINNIDATNLASGTIPSARFTNTFNASSGAYLKLVSTTTVSTQVSSISFTFEPDSHYWIHGRKILTSSNKNEFTLRLLRSGSTVSTSQNVFYVMKSDYDLASRSYSSNHTRSNAPLEFQRSSDRFIFSIRVSTLPISGSIDYFAMNTDSTIGSAFGITQGTVRVSDNALGAPINGMSISVSYFDVGTEILLYKLGET